MLRAHFTGCTIDGNVARLIHLGRSRDGVAVRTEVREVTPRSPGRRLSARLSALRQGIDRHVSSGAVTCLPTERVRYHRLRLAPIPDAEMHEAVLWQTVQEFGMPPEAMRTDFYDIGETLEDGKRRREIVVVATMVNDLEAHVDDLHSIGLSVVAVDTSAGALARLVGRDPLKRHSSSLIVELGVPSSTLTVEIGGVPRFIHAFTRPNPTDLLTMARELHDEVNLCLEYLHGTHGIEVPQYGWVVGTSRRHGEVLSVLNDRSDIEYRLLVDALPAVFGSLRDSIQEQDDLEDWLLPLGLALYTETATSRTAA